MLKRRVFSYSLQSMVVALGAALVFLIQTRVNSTNFSLHKGRKSGRAIYRINSDYKNLVLSYHNVAADVLWINFLQFIEFKDLEVREKGWTFRILDSVTKMDPKFHVAYSVGATALSVFADDIEGARIIFERGILNFPKDWTLQYRAGYHYLFEVKNCKLAAEHFQNSAMNGAPPWATSLAAKLLTKSGQYEMAEAFLKDAQEKFKGEEVEVKLKKRLEELELAKQGKILSDPYKDLPTDCLQNK